MVELAQAQNEALIDLMVLATYQDRMLSLAEHQHLLKRLEELNWRSGESVELFVDRATAAVREAAVDVDSREAFVKERCEAFDSPEVRLLVLHHLNTLLRADGTTGPESEFLRDVERWMA